MILDKYRIGLCLLWISDTTDSRGILRGYPMGIIKAVGVKGYGVILIWDLNMNEIQTAKARHHWP